MAEIKGFDASVEQVDMSIKVASFKDIKPETDISVKEAKNFLEGLFFGDRSVEKNDYPSTYEDRLKQTPCESDRGHWEGERGESKYTPYDEKIKEILDEYGLDGIVYKDGIPDFSGCLESTVEIDNMSENRESKNGKEGNYEQADQKCAEQWNIEGRDGKTDWTGRDVSNWRRENGYTWHECNDRKTCQLIPTKINDYFGHLGGVAECKKANSKEDGFDE